MSSQKDNHFKPFGGLQPIKFRSQRWGSVRTDFMTHLIETQNLYDSITTSVDRFSRRAHFYFSRFTSLATDLANSFADIFRHHGLHDSMISDCHPKFASDPWSRLTELCGIGLRLSSSHRPKTDGSSAIMNCMIEKFLRCYCAYHQGYVLPRSA